MKKQHLDAILVVEGKTDKDLIDSFLDCDIVLTNGSEVSRGTIDYLKEASKTRPIIILTDPDTPGKRIRDILNHEIPTAQNAFVPKEKSIKRHKVGVAESDPDTILDALSHLIPTKPSPTSDLTMSDLFDLGLMGQDGSTEKRKALEDSLHLGHTNGKTLLSRLRALGYTRQQLEEICHGR